MYAYACDMMCMCVCVCVYSIIGKVSNNKSKTLVGLERNGWTEKMRRRETMDNRMAAVLKRLYFLP